ncbi:tRNA lysidine(34) synthetase TilS [Marinicrinis sediminis]|uniref:tRNA(Ile)-lysidine synthase n=1 Tax=Marinicrinis sediminis TaxID=1652465 RepID=A0ABW5R8X8_9BACL
MGKLKGMTEDGRSVRMMWSARQWEKLQLEPYMDEDERIIVAVSGGPDSVALFHILREWSASPAGKRLELEIAHINHQLREQESRQEEQMVRELARSAGVPFHVTHLDVKAEMAQSGKGLQEAARDLRYAFLTELATKRQASVALGHHADDQAETILMRVIRGTGIAGLGGMSVVRYEKKVKLIRPLLRIPKVDLISFCEQGGYPYAEDSSNLSTRYTRNQVRLEVMPQLSKINPQISDALVRLGDQSRSDEHFLMQQAQEVFHNTVKTEGADCLILQAHWLELHPSLQRRLIKLILSYLLSHTRKKEADFETIEQFREACERQDRANFVIKGANGVNLVKEYGQLRFTGAVDGPEPFAYVIWDWRAQPEWMLPGGIHLTFEERWLEREGFESVDSIYAASFDADALLLPMEVRSRQPGDRMQIHGLNGSKKVKDMLIDRKIPRLLRDGLPLLADAKGRILWMPGVARSAHALISPTTKRILHIRTSAFIQSI